MFVFPSTFKDIGALVQFEYFINFLFVSRKYIIIAMFCYLVDVYAVAVTAVIVKRLVMTLFLHCALSRRGSIHSLEA